MKHNRELPLYGDVAAAFIALVASAVAYGFWTCMGAVLRTSQAALGALR